MSTAQFDVDDLLDTLRGRRDFPWNVPDWLPLEELIAALEHLNGIEPRVKEFPPPAQGDQ